MFGLRVLVSILLAASLYFIPAHAQAQASCGSISYGPTFPGGTVANRTCNGKVVSGVGPSPANAQSNLSGFVALIPGRYCAASYSPVSQFVGGFTSSWSCTDAYGSGYYVGGLGSTATDLGANTLSLAQLYLAANIACRTQLSDVSSYQGGFKAYATCSKVSGQAIVSGVGSTATATGVNIRGFAELVASGNTCIMTGPMQTVGALFKAVFYCTKGTAVGYGSTATLAGQDALMQAQGM